MTQIRPLSGAEDTRVRIVRLLRKRGRMRFPEIVKKARRSKDAVNRGLRGLEKDRLVIRIGTRTEGGWQLSERAEAFMEVYENVRQRTEDLRKKLAVATTNEAKIEAWRIIAEEQYSRLFAMGFYAMQAAENLGQSVSHVILWFQLVYYDTLKPLMRAMKQDPAIGQAFHDYLATDPELAALLRLT